MKEKLIAIVAFTLLLNFSVAIMMYTIPGFIGMDAKLGLSQDDIVASTNSNLFNAVGEPINGIPAGTDTANIDSNTLADRVGISSVAGLLNLLNNMLFGIIEILQAMFGSILQPYIFIVLKVIMTLLYLFSAIEFFTSKELN